MIKKIIMLMLVISLVGTVSAYTYNSSAVNVTILNSSDLCRFVKINYEYRNFTNFITPFKNQDITDILLIEQKRIDDYINYKAWEAIQKEKEIKEDKILSHTDFYEDNQTNQTIYIIKDSLLSNSYETNTTKEPETLNKIEYFYNILPSMTYQNMKDLILDQEGRLSNNILFDYEIGRLGSYKLEAIGHTNRAMIVMLMWKIANIEDKQQQQLDCWDLTTQGEIIQCMRNIN